MNKRIEFGNEKEKLLKILLIVMIVFPYVITIMFSVLSDDDFSMYTVLSHEKPLIMESFEKALYYWQVWGGGIPFFFCQFLFNPLNFFPADGYGAGIILQMIFFLFLFVLWNYVKAICIQMFKVTDINAYWIYVIVLIGILNTGVYNEIYYWFVGSTYLMYIILMLLNQIMIIRYMNNDYSNKYSILLIIVGFIACFSYQLAVCSGIIYIIEIVASHNFKNVKRWIPLMFMILGGMISAFAPGNFNRHYGLEEGFNIGTTMLNSIQLVTNALIKMMATPYILLVIVLLVVIGAKYIRLQKDYLLIYILGGLISVWGVLFPYTLGTGRMDMPNRIYYLSNTMIFIWVVLISLQAGNTIRIKAGKLFVFIKEHSVMIFFCSIILFVTSMSTVGVNTNMYRYEELPWIYTASNIVSAFDESNYYKSIIKDIYDSEEKNVEVMYVDYPSTGIIRGINIGPYVTDWINQDIAKCAGKDTIKLVYE